MNEDRFSTKLVRASDIDSFVESLVKSLKGDEKTIYAIRAYLHLYSQDCQDDVVSLRRCPICKQFPEISYCSRQGFGVPSAEVSLRCKCAVGARGCCAYDRPYPSDESREKTVRCAEECAVEAWNRLVTERLEDLNDANEE